MKHKVKIKFNKYWLAIFLIAIIVTAGALRDLSQSLFFHKQNRVNVLFYGNDTRYYSFGIDDAVNYDVSFFPDLKIRVPGGYGYYRIGALGKLIKLERRPQVFKQAFSYATSSFVDYYFYADSEEIYYGIHQSDPNNTPSFMNILFLHTNASLFDRLYIALLFSRFSPEQYKTIHDVPYEKKGDDLMFLAEDFRKSNGGFFYDKIFRTEKKEVQILYSDYYGNADAVGTILEGNGIRVSDISESDKPETQCVIREQASKYSETAKELAGFFQCALQPGSTDIYDIIFVLGDKEKEWAAK